MKRAVEVKPLRGLYPPFQNVGVVPDLRVPHTFDWERRSRPSQHYGRGGFRVVQIRSGLFLTYLSASSSLMAMSPRGLYASAFSASTHALLISGSRLPEK